MSRQEYDEFLETAKQLTSQKVADGKISISEMASDGPNAFLIDGQRDLDKIFREIVVNFDRDSVKIPGMILQDSYEIHANRSIYGAWDGLKWKHQDYNGRAEFALGVLRDSGRYLLLYEVQRQTVDFKVEQFEIALIYD